MQLLVVFLCYRMDGILTFDQITVQACNAASSCFAIVTNNVSMSFDLTVTFSTNSTYNSSTADNVGKYVIARPYRFFTMRSILLYFLLA